MWIMNNNMADALALSVGSDSINPKASLKGSFLALIDQPFNPQPSDSFDTYHEASFNGYARGNESPAWSPFTGQGGMALIAGQTILFELGSSTAPATLYGHCLLGSDSVTLLAAEVFNPPISLANPGDGFLDTPIFGFAPKAGYGTSAISF